jgi:hypothetical protein
LVWFATPQISTSRILGPWREALTPKACAADRDKPGHTI